MGLIHNYKHFRSQWRKAKRLLFASPAEVRFIEIMGGKVWRIRGIHGWHSGFPLVVSWRLGKILGREYFMREVQVGKYFVDFGCVTRYYRKAIEIDGADWHNDILKENERDKYLREHGFKVLHIHALQVYHYPEVVRKKVMRFLEA